MTSNDPRTIATRKQLREALLSLCEEKALSAISVTALCAEAGVARKTFYAHYDDIDTLAREHISDVLLPIFEAISDEDLAEPERGLVINHVLAGVGNDMERVVGLHRAFSAELIMSVLHPVAVRLARRMLQVNGLEDEFLTAYLSASSASLALSGFRTWMARDFVDDPQQIARFMTVLLGRGTRELLTQQDS